jgi:NMD protein affecting ribosome stability and mRNA decay
MTKIFKTRSSVKVPKSKTEQRHDEYGKAHKGFTVCRRCRNIFFKKEWHRPDNAVIRQARRDGKDVHYSLCPACTMIENHTYEGELLIKNLPPSHARELLFLIRAFGKRATLKDPQDRIIAVTKSRNGCRITTTENQLAVRLAKKIRDAFRASKIHISYSREPYEIDRVVLTFS